jgi:hypothetical protein
MPSLLFGPKSGSGAAGAVGLEDVGARILGTVVNDVLPEDLQATIIYYQYYGDREARS